MRRSMKRMRNRSTVALVNARRCAIKLLAWTLGAAQHDACPEVEILRLPQVSLVENRNALRIFLNQQHYVMTEAEARTY